MNDQPDLAVVGTEKVRDLGDELVITLPREAIESSALNPTEYAVIATNGRSIFLIPSTAESLHEAVHVGEGPTPE